VSLLRHSDILPRAPADPHGDESSTIGSTGRPSLKQPAPIRQEILSAICRDADGNPEPDPRDSESVPLPAGADPDNAAGVPASALGFVRLVQSSRRYFRTDCTMRRVKLRGRWTM
jgi:hypothetical protein